MNFFFLYDEQQGMPFFFLMFPRKFLANTFTSIPQWPLKIKDLKTFIKGKQKKNLTCDKIGHFIRNCENPEITP